MAGLNQSIKDTLDIQQIKDLNALVHSAQLLYEQQQRKKKEAWNTTKRYGSNPSSNSNFFSSNPSMQQKGASRSHAL